MVRCHHADVCFDLFVIITSACFSFRALATAQRHWPGRDPSARGRAVTVAFTGTE